MRFLLENERGWVGASRFFEALTKLNMNPALYILPCPFIFKPDEVQYYTESILNDLTGKPKTDDYYYIKKICICLQSWASEGRIVHVL